ncbi:MAG: helix-turn-helix transcriptional regulator [Algibacter sp.]|uniref:helix-turn-helix transcriptional regulator n=1 Tax=Algibacter sp. TaxID=1872428 RepID=UPI00262F3002|nr:helix-turn-helix transcriptional regulator [Algibacter sp.]MDG1729280.1 helix-turn-helix transcriptional regulator [Algibacter sp.]MDG2178999.1 helix-turn-helix transcriptional regulator [Algibacter sp.]
MPPQEKTYHFTPVFEYSSSMHWIVLFICIVIGIIIIFQSVRIAFSKNKTNKTTYRYLILAVLFLLYNLLNGLLPNTSLPGPIFIQYITTYSISIVMCVYLVWYLYQEFNIITPNKFFKIKNLIWILSFTFVFLFVLPYYFTESLNFARSLFLVFPTFLSITFLIYFFMTIKKEVKRQRYFKIQTYLGLSSIFSIILLPLLTYFGDFQPITQPLVTMAFFFVTIMEINSYSYRLKNTYILKRNIGREYNFTNRENEIAIQILKRKNYKDISSNMFISYGTVRKHASNIFTKSNVSNKDEFIDKFKE